MKILKRWAVAAAMLGSTGSVQAALIDRGGGMIYDSTLNITWLADMNYAKTSGYDSDGLMTWDAALVWADKLEYGGYDNWRLPTLNPSDTSCSLSFDPGGGLDRVHLGFNCTGGELSRLFVTELGNKAAQSVLNPTNDAAEQIANLALFSNLESSVYWGDKEFAPNPAAAWSFRTGLGLQGNDFKDDVFHAMAVRPGDVAVASQPQGSVPEPATLALALLALGATIAVRRRRVESSLSSTGSDPDKGHSGASPFDSECNSASRGPAVGAHAPQHRCLAPQVKPEGPGTKRLPFSLCPN